MVEQPVHLNLNLTTTQKKVLSSNPLRVYALIINSSDTDCVISLGIPAAATEGIPLYAAGGYHEINLTNPYHGEIYARSAGVTKRLNITEISQ